MLVALALLVQLQDTAASSRSHSNLTHRNGRIPPAVTAVRASAPIRLDGTLDEADWERATPATDFRRDVPADGKEAAEPTEVRILYDRDALYVGARLHHRSTPISKRLSRRDSFGVFNDVFFVMLDSYHDHRTAFVLGVTPAGERRDMATTGDGGNRDASWDPVWEAATEVDSLGWTAELRIPFSQLRFPPSDEQVWGIQFRRDIRAAGEAVDWAWTPRTESGQASKFGHLLGLRGIPAPKRLELLPYSVAQLRLTDGADPRSPFDDGRVASQSGGLDLKYGLTSDLTLDATVNPDFGQVEADPAVVNLTAFETFFEERRPFFIEGAGILEFGVRDQGQNFYYSRRIGRAPSLSANGAAPFVDQAPAASILGATKLTGRTRSGWSIGAIAALTGREFARLADSGARPLPKVAIEPLAGYGVLRIKRDFRDGASGIGLLGTTVARDLSDPSFAVLRSSAVAGGLDFFHRFGGGAFEIRGGFGGSLIRGDTAAINRAQRASTRYFARPDQESARFDSTRTSLSGAAAELSVGRINGSWTYNASANVISPGLELNDLGFQTQADRLVLFGRVNRRWLTPTRTFRSFNVDFSAAHGQNFDGDALRREAELNLNAELASFWGFRVNVERGFRSLDDRATRGGPVIERPAGWELSIGGRSDGRKVVSAGIGLDSDWNERGGWSFRFNPEVTVRSGGAFSFTLSPGYRRSREAAFYVGTFGDPSATATFGARYLFAGLDQNTLSLTTRINLVLTPHLSVQVFAQPFVASGDYAGYKLLSAARSFRFGTLGTNGSTIAYDPSTLSYHSDPDGSGPAAAFTFRNPDFSVRSLRSNVVVRWEYRPGSTLFVVWNQNRAFAGSDPRFRALRDLRDVFGDDQRNVFFLKGSYYFTL
ncbi:MAG: carbohydrate binding family 9 domain-containing protein [Gemmatimonadetes bacterium]|nr:carbohydrate binding family 9 domain-containing protein [Gemmatimonadota bacterium]